MITFNQLDKVQQAKAIKYAFDDIAMLIAEGFLEFNPNTKMGQKIKKVTDHCKTDPTLNVIHELSMVCGDEITEFALLRAENSLYDVSLFESVEA